MIRCPRARRVLVRCGTVAAIGSALALSLLPSPVAAHGSTREPASRTYACRFDDPDNPMCAKAWSANPQALYDWMEVNIGDAAGRHRELIPDGRLCSAGRSKYAAFDQPGAWPVTALRTDGSGLVDLAYENTAPHATEYYRVYLTRPGFDASTDSLAWDDLELRYDSGPLGLVARQDLRVPLPRREVPAILYIVWQRSDSPEAFYACSDVTIDAGSGPPPPTTTTSEPAPTSAPPVTSASTTGPPTSSPPPTVPSTSTSTSTRTDPTSVASPGTAGRSAPPPSSAPSSTAGSLTTGPSATAAIASDRPAPTSAVATPDDGVPTTDATIASAVAGPGPSPVPPGSASGVGAESGPSVVSPGARPSGDPTTPAAAGGVGQPVESAAIDPAGSTRSGPRLLPLVVAGLGSVAALLVGLGVRLVASHRRSLDDRSGRLAPGARHRPGRRAPIGGLPSRIS